MPIESVVLDLDETLVHGVFHKNENITLKIRPYCKEFLEYLFENFNVGIWTMANVSWCDTVLEHILTKEQQEKLKFVYTSQNSCPRDEGDIKCLHKIFKKKNYKEMITTHNTIIVEDTYHNIKENVHNGIIIPRFHGDNKDDCLFKLLEHFKKYKEREAKKFPKNVKW